MTILDRVRDFIAASSPGAVCDDCIKDRLSLTVRQHANHKTRELAKNPALIAERGGAAYVGLTRR